MSEYQDRLRETYDAKIVAFVRAHEGCTECNMPRDWGIYLYGITNRTDLYVRTRREYTRYFSHEYYLRYFSPGHPNLPEE